MLSMKLPKAKDYNLFKFFMKLKFCKTIQKHLKYTINLVYPKNKYKLLIKT